MTKTHLFINNNHTINSSDLLLITFFIVLFILAYIPGLGEVEHSEGRVAFKSEPVTILRFTFDAINVFFNSKQSSCFLIYV